jgi:hypothetical protein
MSQRKAPGVNRGLNTDENLRRVGREQPIRQRRSAEEIAFAYVKRTLPLLEELREGRHRLDACRRGGLKQ